MSLLAGRTALVTGGANGIGRAIVERLAAEGAVVAAVDVEPVPGLGGSVHGVQWDLSRTETLDDLVAEAEAAVGPLDILVNNAGVFEAALAVDLTLDSYRRVLDVNLHAPVFLASRAARGMCERGYGRIVNITSIHGRFGEETALAYDKLPLRRFAMPEEIAEHVAWLACERNTYVTGQVLTVDGGVTVTF